MVRGNFPIFLCVATLAAASFFTTDLRAQEFTIGPGDVKGDGPDYSPYVDRNIPDQVFFGDTHHHTSNSPDAGLIGNILGPEDSYRFARGEEVTSSTGLRAKLIRPLDFLVVSDHAEYLGLPALLRTSDPVLLDDPIGKRWHDLFRAGKGYDLFLEILGSAMERKEALKSEAIKRTVWERNVEVSDQYNEPGRFTAFIGFEWSSGPQGNNLHRVVVFRDGADRANQVLPFSLFDSEDPEDLWLYLANYEQGTGSKGPAEKFLPSRTTETFRTVLCSLKQPCRVHPSIAHMGRLGCVGSQLWR